MNEDDLVSYRQYTINTAGMNRTGKKRPAPVSPPIEATTNQFDEELDDFTATNPKQRVSKFSIDFCYTIYLDCF